MPPRACPFVPSESWSSPAEELPNWCDAEYCECGPIGSNAAIGAMRFSTVKGNSPEKAVGERLRGPRRFAIHDYASDAAKKGPTLVIALREPSPAIVPSLLTTCVHDRSCGHIHIPRCLGSARRLREPRHHSKAVLTGGRQRSRQHSSCSGPLAPLVVTERSSSLESPCGSLRDRADHRAGCRCDRNDRRSFRHV